MTSQLSEASSREVRRPEIPWWWEAVGWDDPVWHNSHLPDGRVATQLRGTDLTLTAAPRGDEPICGEEACAPNGQATRCIMPPDHWESPHFGPLLSSGWASSWRLVAVSHAKAAS